MELQDYLRIFRKSWVLILASTLIITGLTAVWSMMQTPSYKATAQLYVSVRTGDSSIGEMQQGTNWARQAVTSYVDVVDTSIVMDKVSAELGGSPTARELAAAVSASSPTNTVLINISAVSQDPEEAALVANTTSTVFSDVVMNQLERPSEGAPARVQVDVVQPAQVPGAAESPNVKRNLALGVLLGLSLGFGLAVLRSVLDTRIRTRADVGAITNDPVLGSIVFDPDSSTRPLLVQDDPTSPRAEAFRSFRTNLQFLRVEGNPRSFVFTSAVPEEGKSTTAANLSIAIAQAGSTVCLVDGDLRKPRVADLMGVEGGVGVTDVLIGRVSLGDALQGWGQPNLFILPAGHRPPNPSELLGSSEMQQLLNKLKGQFDYVIVDAPPVLVVTDAALIAKEVSGALMVAGSGIVRKEPFREALVAMDQIDARVLGIVMTMVPVSGADAYGYTSYTYGSPEHHGVDVSPRRVDSPVGKWRKPGAVVPGGAGTVIGSGR